MNEIVSYCLSYCLLSRSKYTLKVKMNVVIPDLTNEISSVKAFISNTIVRSKKKLLLLNSQKVTRWS